MTYSSLTRIFAFVLATTLFSGAASAEDAAKIAIINIQSIMHDSTAAKSVKAQLDSKQKAYQSELSKKEEKLQKEDQNLAKQRGVLSQEEFEKKIREFKKEYADAQKDVQAKKGKLDKAFAQALNDIQKSVYDIVAAISKERGYSIVIPTSQILYANPDMDISTEVLEKLNKNLPDLKVKFDE